MQHDAIIATLPPAFFKEYTLERFENEMEKMNHDDEMIWFMVLKNLPKVQTPYFYFLYDGKIRYRADISQLIRNSTMRFARADGNLKTFANKNFVQLIGPTVRAPYDIPMRGFQGFRYSELLF
jgi:hypothetical protein